MKIFNTLADLQAARFASTGQLVQVKGTDTTGDGGIDFFLIQNSGTPDGVDVFATAGSKVAVRQKGAKASLLAGRAKVTDTTQFATGTTTEGVVANDATWLSLVGTTITVETQGFHSGSTVGNAKYKFLNAADSAAAGYVDGSSRFQCKGLDVYACLVVDNIVDIEQFGAYAGAVDNLPSIQAAVNLSKSIGEPFLKIVIPTGNFNISGMIDRTGSGFYADIVGSGKRSSILTLTGSASSVINMADSGNVTGRTTVKDLTIRCANNADYAIDAKNMRYWTLKNVEITNPNITGVRCGNWLTRILNNEIEGCPKGLLIEGVDSNPAATNNLIVKENDIKSCDVGLETVNIVNDLNILENSFDQCSNAAIYVKTGARSCNIKGNYFEACGNGTGVDVETSSGVFTTIPAAIVTGYRYDAQATTLFSGVVNDNFFANCNTSRYISVWNVGDCEIKGNKVHGAYTTAALVEVNGVGCLTTTCRRLEVTGSYPSGVVGKILELNGNDPEDNHCNIVVNNERYSAQSRALFVSNNPKSSSWSANTNVIQSVYQDAWSMFEFDAVTEGGSVDTDLDINLDANSPILGRYLRVQYLTEGDGVSDNGVWFQAYVDGSLAVSITRTFTDFTESGRGVTFYVPTSTTTLRLRLRNVVGTSNAKIYGFSVCDAAFPLGCGVLNAV